MADIFISYGREDQKTARMLAQALAGQRWSVWWDQGIPPGKTWADVVGKQLTAHAAFLRCGRKLR
jgi:hypothetical protein